MIAFVGSVFSPYYAWARRRGKGDPTNFCAINVAVYGERAQRWAMTERGRASLARDPVSLTVGPSRVAWDGAALVVDVDEIAAPLPARVTGRIRLHPAALTAADYPLDAGGRHLWRPIAPRARIEVDFVRPSLRWAGEGYLDSNWGASPLEAAFARWTWSRAHIARDTAILYDVAPRRGAARGLALRFDAHGGAEAFDPPAAQRLPPGLWRVGRATRAEAGFAAGVVRTLEDTPFYMRSIVATRLLGANAVAVHESLCLDRFAQAWVQALLPFRMPRALG